MAKVTRTDTERLDWLEKQEGFGVISDDAGHWAVPDSGEQPVARRNFPIEMETTFFVPKEYWRKTIRAAIDDGMKRDAPATRRSRQ